MKKFLLALLSVICLTCLGLAAAACSEAKYYTLYFNAADGANVVCEIPSGYEVREGYRVAFKVELDDDAYGEPQVAANGDSLEADSEGYYSFKMKKDTTVTVSGVYTTGRNSIVFDKGDSNTKTEYRITYSATYVDDSGKTVVIDTEDKEGTSVKAGTEVTFTIDVSVYYGKNPQFNVLENTQLVERDTDGKYRVTVDSKKTISVQGLELDDSFVARKDDKGNLSVDGNGTSSNPYKIRKPIDLYVLASYMSTDFYYLSLSTAYYSLEADIDMKGEELFIIGASDAYYFAGNFNGNGHTISNYYISDTAIDQETFVDGFMSDIGLFGVAIGAEIYDLNIESFTYNINAAKWGETFFAGGIVARGVGVVITNCSVSGNMSIAGDTNYFGYAGGIIGYQMSAYDESSATYYLSTVRSCHTDVIIEGRSGYIYGAGGIVGRMSSYNEMTPAMVINSYATGDVSGAMRTGGIAGVVSAYGSVINSYATGYVDAYNRVGNTNVDDQSFLYAYSGGIAGELEFEAIVANCFFAGDATATAALGTDYAVSDDIAGHVGDDGGYVHTQGALVFNCAPDKDKNITVDDINSTFIKNTLGWNEVDWKFEGASYPVINKEDAASHVEFSITVNLKNGTVGGSNTVVQNVKDMYYPMSYWYLTSLSEGGENKIPEFVKADDGQRSYGYYFDEDLKVKVPNGFVPTNDVTIYAGFADYNQVAGKYYLKWNNSNGKYEENRTDAEGNPVFVYSFEWQQFIEENGRNIDFKKYIELKPDGTLIYHDGALTSESYYYYDGQEITLRDSYIAIMIDSASAAYSSFKANVVDGVMTIYDNKNTVEAVKYVESFGYGTYYNGSVEYTFYADGAGVYNNGTSTRSFTYKLLSGNGIEITLDGNTIDATYATGSITVDGTAYTAYHNFMGVWENSAGSHKQYTFDGKGGWSYLYYGYDNDGKLVNIETPKTGSYTVSGNTINLGNGTTFTIKDGVLMLNGKVSYYKQNSYAGTWNNFAILSQTRSAIEITLGGITAEGYGKATIDYGTTYGKYDATYDVRVGTLKVAGVELKDQLDTYVRLYRNDFLIATLIYQPDSRTLWGPVYQVSSGVSVPVTFYMYDDFKGDWVSSGYEVTFNGLGNYNKAGTATTLAVQGIATVNGKAGTYTLDNNTLEGKIVCDGTTYTISYDEVNGTVKLNGTTLHPRDEWYGIKLIDKDSGKIYSFNGKGNVGSGTIKVTDKNGTSYPDQSYTAGVTVKVDGNDYKLDNKTVYLYTPFTGKWYISGSYGKTLEIGYFNAANTAEGTYCGDPFTFTYYADGNYVTITDPADEDALPLYINILDGNNVIELAVSLENSTFGLYSVCIGGNFDKYKGDYSYDGGTLTLDGFGSSKFTVGAAKYVKGGNEVESFTYTVDEFGQVLLQSAKDGKYYIFCEADGGEYTAVTGGATYTKVLPDNLYRVKAYKDKTEFAFLGNGTAKAGSDVYTYVIEDQNPTGMEYVVTLTKDGVAVTYVLDYSSDIYTLTEKTNN